MATNRTKDRFKEIEELAYAAGLKHYDVQFFEVPTSVIYEVASYGLPTRYSHWSFGRVYQYQKTQGEMGHSKIYELILNNNPSFAFLDTSNTETINLMIAAHCYGHADFFANNIMFREAREENMVQVAKKHAEAIDQYRKDYGDDEVDDWLDVALAMEHHIDVYKKLKRSKYPKRHVEFKERNIGEWEDLHPSDDPLVKKVVEGANLPPKPEKDLLWFLTEYANMEDWQKRIFEIVRRESYYFYPQYRTKIMNEGWACLVGSSYVLTSDGYQKFDRVVGKFLDSENINVCSGLGNKDDSSKFVMTGISDTHITIPKKTRRIVNDLGISIEGALNHGLFASKNETVNDFELSELEIGDFVTVALGSNVWNNNYEQIDFTYPQYSRTKTFKIPETVDEKFAEFLGFFLSEGSVMKRGIQITNKDENILQRCSSLILDLFGLEAKINPRSDDPQKFDVQLYSSAIINLLEHLGINLESKSKEKEVPECIMRAPKSVVAAFLSSYFDGDGGCYVANNSIILSTSSPKMAEQIGLLLLNFGIFYKFRSLKKTGYADNFHLAISRKLYFKKFAEEIGFAVHSGKQKCCERAKKWSITDSSSDWIYSKIVDIQDGYDVLYDITVPEGNHYVAQGAINHNSYWHAELMLQYSLGDDNDYGVKGIKHPLTSEEHLDFLSSHEKVVQAGVKIPLKIEQPEMDAYGRPTGRTIKGWHPRVVENPNIFHYATRINPYYVGFRMFRDIKERWDKYFEEGFYEDEWGEKILVSINGNQKIREVMESEDDVSFFRNYLTEKLCDKLHLFAFGSPEAYHDNYKVQEEIQKRLKENSDRQLGNFPIDEQLKVNKTVKVRTKDVSDIVRTMARVRNNYGVPCIVVRRVDSDGTLRLEHVADDLTNVDIAYGKYTLQYVFKVWGRPVELIRKGSDHTHVMKVDATGFTIDHATSDYPEIIEDEDSASSW